MTNHDPLQSDWLLTDALTAWLRQGSASVNNETEPHLRRIVKYLDTLLDITPVSVAACYACSIGIEGGFEPQASLNDFRCQLMEQPQYLQTTACWVWEDLTTFFHFCLFERIIPLVIGNPCEYCETPHTRDEGPRVPRPKGVLNG